MVYGVLLVIDRTGIPVLVRPYGQVQKPPSAAVGIGSAIFHAAKANPHVELRVLASEHRKAVYYQSKLELLAVLVSESSGNSNASTERMLELVCRLVELLVGPGQLGTGVDSSRLRLATQRHLAAIDYVVTQFTTDARLPFARPIYALEVKKERMNQPSSDLILGLWLRDGEIVAEVEVSDRGTLNFSSADLVLMEILASSTKEAGIRIFNVHPTVNEVEIAVKLARVESDMAENASFLGIFNSNTTADHIHDIVKSRIAEGGIPSDSTTHLEHIHHVFPALRHSVFLCCYVSSTAQPPAIPSRVVRIPPVDWNRAAEDTRGLVDSNSSVLSEKWLTEPTARRMLGRFVSERTSMKVTSVMDYKREDEVFTFIQCIRGPVVAYILCGGSVTFDEVVRLGDEVISSAAGARWK